MPTPTPVPVILLAGGFGTRLSSVVSDRPKCLAEVAGRPFLDYILAQIAAAGCRELVVSVHFMADQIRRAVGSRHGDIAVRYVEEPAPLGTGGALRLAMEAVEGDAFLAMNADSFLHVDLADLVSCPRPEGSSCLASTWMDSCLRFGKVRFGDHGRIDGFEEKSPVDSSGWINAGIYLLHRSALEIFSPGDAFSLENRVFPYLVEKGMLYGKQFKAPFIDIGTPASYGEAQTFFQGLPR